MSDVTKHDELESPLQLGLAAARKLVPAGSILISFAVGILVCYRYVPAVTAVLDRIAEIKESGGLWLPVVSTALFGGVLPTVFQQMIPSTRSATAWARLPFFTAFWAYKGFEINLLYNTQARIFGDGTDLGTLATKVAFDQFVFSMWWAVPTTVIVYALPDAGYRIKGLPASLGPQWFKRRVIPILVANWMVWIPTVVVIYSLKLPLQLPLQNIILGMWAILLLLLVQKPVARPVEAIEAAAHKGESAD